MRFKFFLALIIALFALAVFAQEETPIPINVGTTTGFISAENISDRYSIELSAGQQLIVTMTATAESDLDARLFLFDAAGGLLANDDDSAGDKNAQIVFNVTSAGLYIIEATRYQEEEGNTIGAYNLSITISTTNGNDPLSLPPNFAVPFTQMVYEETVTGELSGTNRLSYFVIGAQQGDFVRIELNTTSGDLNADIQLINQELQIVSRLSESNPTNKVIFATIPQTAWYLIAITQQSGAGSFSLTPSLVSDTLLSESGLVEGRFDENTDTYFFVLNATINERIFVNLTITEGENLLTSISIEDLNRITLADSVSAGTQSRVSITVPRSSPYIVQVRNTGTNRVGAFQLQLRRTPVDINKLQITDAEYNQNYAGFVSENSPIRYYRFSGKAGELVTIRMVGGERNLLDPYLILADSAFNELVFNDNSSASSNALISQFRLPADGDYYILASRQGLANGTTIGSYNLAITVGEIKLETGRLTVTLTWQGFADLNLFVRTPSRYTVSWANPSEPNGGLLQIDSNTGCETLTAQPIEHVYWPLDSGTEDFAGDYTIWVWYQATCTNLLPVSFTLTVAVDGETILTRSSSPQEPLILRPNQRHESIIRINANRSAVVVNEGTTSNPSPQQTESQGGDTLIGVAPQTGEINDLIFAQFYQFEGEEGDRVRIRVERITGDLDPMLFLRDSLDQPLAENDDISPGDNNSQIEYTLPESGIYVIVVSRYGLRDGTTLGDYRLSLERLED